MLISASNGGAATTYAYDAADRLAIETSGTTQGAVLWDGARIIAHGDPAALVIDVPGIDVDQHVASVDNDGNGTARFYHQGPDQSMLAVTDANGLVEGYSYSAFGEPQVWSLSGTRLSASLIGNRFGFQGQWLDPTTGSYAMRARQYVPRWGRFTSRDPIGLGGGPSLYAFTGSRPIATRDPSGLAPVGQNGFRGAKWSSYAAGWGVWGMGDGDWGGFNATGGIGDYPFLPTPDDWNPVGPDPSAGGPGGAGPTGDAVHDGKGLMAGPGAPTGIPPGVSCSGGECSNADGSPAGTFYDGQFLPVQTYHIAEVAPVGVAFILPVSPWLLPSTWRVFPDPFAPNRTIAVAPNGFTMAYDKPGKNQGGRGPHWHIHSPPYNPEAHFKPGTEISDPFSALPDVDTSLVLGVYYGAADDMVTVAPDPLHGMVPMVPVTMGNAGLGSLATPAVRAVDPAPFFEFFGPGELVLP